jgi:NDP-sugar pyrophosphorylase family protein
MIPGARQEGMRIHAYPFRGYWRDVSSLKDYFEANLDMSRVGGVARRRDPKHAPSQAHLPGARARGVWPDTQHKAWWQACVNKQGKDSPLLPV